MMARYIDADSIRYTDLNSDMPTSNVRVWVTFKEWIDKMPTADVVERKMGEWIVSSDGRIKCSNCLKIPINEIRIRGNIVYDMIPINKLMKFCPNCGADMRKEV